MKDADSTTSSVGTPSCSTIIAFTLSAVSLLDIPLLPPVSKDCASNISHYRAPPGPMIGQDQDGLSDGPQNGPPSGAPHFRRADPGKQKSPKNSPSRFLRAASKNPL